MGTDISLSEHTKKSTTADEPEQFSKIEESKLEELSRISEKDDEEIENSMV